MHFGIIGGGFGLYGYVPAVLGAGFSHVSILSKYRDKLLNREELAPYHRSVRFCVDLEQMFSTCDGVIIATPPGAQYEIINELLTRGWSGSLIIEKPVAPTPQLSRQLLSRLFKSQIKVRMGFTVASTRWFEQLETAIRREAHPPALLNFSWDFLANHYQHNLGNWKARTIEGGGALRFYGIHIISALAKLDNWKVLSCQRSIDSQGGERTCSFTAATQYTQARLGLNTFSSNPPLFQVTATDKGSTRFTFSASDPFTIAPVDSSDRSDLRVPILLRIIRSLAEDSGSYYQWYDRHITLWEQIEACGVNAI